MTIIVADALASWLAYRGKLVALDLVARSTLDNQEQIVATIGRAIGAVALDRLRKSDIELFIGERLRSCSPVTVRGELDVLRQILNWCLDEGMLVTKPRLPTVKVPNTETALPSDEAFLWVLANVPAHHARALEFMMLTGLSPHELERVQVQDASAYRRMSDDFTLGSPGELGELGIGQRPDFPVKQESRRRWIPLNGRAKTIWFQEASGAAADCEVFPSGEAMQKAIVRARDDASAKTGQAVPGTERVTPKMMRKWFASKVASEHPEHVLQKLLGHAPGSKITRQHYVRSNDAQAQSAVESLSA